MKLKDRAMTPKEVAEFLNVSVQMIYNMIKDEQIPAFKIGTATRILYSDLMDLIESRKNMKEIGEKDQKFFEISDFYVRHAGFEVGPIDLKMPKDKILAIIGPSGAGKTTLVRGIAGIDEDYDGDIVLGNQHLTRLPVNKRKIAYVFQDYALFPHYDVKKNLEFPLTVKRMNKQKMSEEVLKRLKELDIPMKYLDFHPSKLPEGVKQLCAIARARNREYEMLLLDEPMSSLDRSHHLEMRVMLQRLFRELNTTTVVNFNSPEDALAVSDYLAVIHQGKLIQFGKTMQVYEEPVSEVVMELLSRIAVNSFDVKIKNGMVEEFNLETEKRDGDYRLMFRAEDVVGSDEGISSKILKSRFYAGDYQISEALCKDQDIQILTPIKAGRNFKFKPVKFYLFSKNGEE